MYKKCGKIADTTKKSIMTFNGHIKRVEPERFGKKFLTFQDNTYSLSVNARKDLQIFGIKKEGIRNRNYLETKLRKRMIYPKKKVREELWLSNEKRVTTKQGIKRILAKEEGKRR